MQKNYAMISNKYKFSILDFWLISNCLLFPVSFSVLSYKLTLNIILLIISGMAYIAFNRMSSNHCRFNLITFLFVILSTIIALLNCTDNFEKYLISAPVFIYIVMLATKIGFNSRPINWINLKKSAIIVILISNFFIALEFFQPNLFPDNSGYNILGRYSGIFNEPSHLVIGSMPCIAILLASRKSSDKLLSIISIFFIIITTKSASYITVALSLISYIIFYNVNKNSYSRINFFIFSCAGLTTLIIYLIYSDIFLQLYDRVIGVFDVYGTDNLSSLVYVQGLYDLIANIKHTNGLGLGFNMMGCLPLPNNIARDRIYNLFNVELNTQDGSFIFSKVMSEFGIFGLFAFIYLARYIVRLKGTHKLIHDIYLKESIKIQSYLLFTLFISCFVRGTGYYNVQVIFIIIIMASMLGFKNNENKC